jgi:hypothetical protein
MVNFVKGRELSRGYYHDLIKPLLNKQYPALKYTAGLIGYGSDVLGYDTEISRDHMWGPRLYLFLSKKDLSEKKEDIMDYLSQELPPEYRGYPTHFSNPDGSGIRRMEAPSQGTVSPLLFLNTPEEMYQEYLGISHSKPLTDSDWLTMGEHRLLAFTAGELFHDELEMEKLRERVSAYPLNIRLYLMASLWEMISQKEAFVGRCGDLGDDMGSRLNATSIVHYLMRLAFCGITVTLPMANGSPQPLKSSHLRRNWVPCLKELWLHRNGRKERIFSAGPMCWQVSVITAWV